MNIVGKVSGSTGAETIGILTAFAAKLPVDTAGRDCLELRVQTLAARAALGPTPFVDDMQRIEFVVMLLIEPAAHKIEKPQARAV